MYGSYIVMTTNVSISANPGNPLANTKVYQLSESSNYNVQIQVHMYIRLNYKNYKLLILITIIHDYKSK